MQTLLDFFGIGLQMFEKILTNYHVLVKYYNLKNWYIQNDILVALHVNLQYHAQYKHFTNVNKDNFKIV